MTTTPDEVFQRVASHRDSEEQLTLELGAEHAESELRARLRDVSALLEVKRGERERLREQIAALVEDETVLTRAVHVFDRWHERSGSESPDVTDESELYPTPLETGI